MTGRQAATVKMPAAQALRAVSYTRISSDDEKKGLGVQRQTEDLRRMAKRLGAEVVAELSDNDLSGSDKVKRPDFDKLITMIEKGEADLVLATDLDRLSRGLKSFVRLFEACEKQAVRVAWKDGEANFRTGDGINDLENRAQFARQELRTMRTRIERWRQEQREQGRQLGSRVPFGWRTKTEIDPVESKVLLAAMADVLKGRSLRDIAQEWSRKRVRGNSAWNAYRVGIILTRPHHAGLITHQGKAAGAMKVDDPKWKPLIDRAMYEQVCSAVTARAVFGSSEPRRKTLLTGLLRCECGEPMFSSSTPSKYDRPRGHQGRKVIERTTVWRCLPAYHDKGCGHVFIRGTKVEELIVEAAITRVDDLDFAQDLKARRAPGPQQQLAQQLAAMDKREQDARDSYAAERISIEDLEAVRKAINTRRESMRSLLAGKTKAAVLSPFAGKPGALRMAWDQLSLDTQRLILSEALGTVTIRAAAGADNRFDPDRVVFGAAKVKAIG